MSGNHIASTEVLTIFQEEVAALEGTISSAVHCRDQLLVRALLPYEGEVRKQDKVQGGVAARATDQGVLVYPYVLRQVCRNGQMMPYYSTQDSTVVECNLSEDPTAYNLREAIRRSGHIATFCDAVASFKLSAATNIDMEGIRAAALGAIEATRTGSNGERRRRQVERIFHRFFQREEPTRFGFMNAVTRIARDTDEQGDRWDLEELGGSIGAGLLPPALNNYFGVALQLQELLGLALPVPQRFTTIEPHDSDATFRSTVDSKTETAQSYQPVE